MKDINLLPEESRASAEIHKEQLRIKVIKSLIGIGIIAVILILSTAIPKLVLKTYDIRINSLTQAMEEDKYLEFKAISESIEAQNEMLNVKSSIISHVERRNYSVREILNTVNNSKPYGVTLNRVRYDQNVLTLDVRAESIPAASEFIASMGRNTFLKPEITTGVLNIPNTEEGFNFQYIFIVDRKGVN